MGEQLLQRLSAFALRLGSMAAGALILRHEVYQTESAEIAVIGLGLWLIGVPPALWLDALRRAGRTLGDLEDRPAGRTKGDGDDDRS